MSVPFRIRRESGEGGEYLIKSSGRLLQVTSIVKES